MPPRLLSAPFVDPLLVGSVAAASTTRHGGVSEAPFATLNCGFSAGDDPVRVAENRRRALAELNLDPVALVVGGQVHDTRVAVVPLEHKGRGALGPDTVLPATDGLLTDVPALPIAVSTADCVPVFLCAPEAGVVGVLHAGWRGTLRGILDRAFDMLQEHWRIEPTGVHLALGPSIGACCYEVGEDVALEATAHPLTDEAHLRPTAPGKWHLDLRGHVAAQARAAGVPAAQIGTQAPCTKCDHATYYSYRAEGARSGRTLSVIALRGG